MSKELINIGSRRELFWDDFMVESEKTTATLRLHKPVKKEQVLHLTKPWEGDGCDYYNLMHDDGVFRMYYLGWNMLNPEMTEHTGSDIKVCYIESKDGKNWYRPDLGLVEFEGSKANNIMLEHGYNVVDNFFAFKDENPNAKATEKYKAVAEAVDGSLWGFISVDALNWTPIKQISTSGKFDTLNVAFWDSESEQYYCYIRDFHNNEPLERYGIRDIRFITSKDFWEWSEPTLIDFNGNDDYALYTNNITPYYRAPHVWTGFPTRYVQREVWTKNFDKLAGPEYRKHRYNLEGRLGLTTTDCVFMSTRDGQNFNRFDEVWLSPGPEHRYNWVYGDCYPACGMIETASDYEGGDNEISMFAFEGKWSRLPSRLFRYTIRLDGFASYHATYDKQTVTTRPFIFSGNSLKLNFSTSAIGNIYIRVLDEEYNELLCSDEIFGDRVDSVIDFENGDIKDFQGKPIRLEFTMSDADIYSFIFE